MRNLIIAIALFLFVSIPLAAKKFGDSEQNNYAQATHLANGLSMASQFKTYIVEYYTATGKLPSNNSESGLPQPESFSNDAVKSVEIQNGTIIATYTKLSGVEGGSIRLIPKPSNGQIKWRCETASYNLINEYMPQCYYVKSIVQAKNTNVPDVRITYFSPLSGDDVTEIGSSSFSVPNPIVVINPISYGSPENHPGESVINQIGAGKIQVRIVGFVFDFIADMVNNNLADIEYITLSHAALGPIAKVPITRIDENHNDSNAIHPLRNELATVPGVIQAIRPYPFIGRFESEVITLPISNGSNGIYAKATNINKKYAVSGIRIKAKFDRANMRYDLVTKLDNKIDIGLFNPILVYIEDSTVTQNNVNNMSAYINGTKVGLRFIEGQLQLDRPIMGINLTPPANIPNLVNVTGDPNHFTIKYKDTESVFGWSFTGY